MSRGSRPELDKKKGPLGGPRFTYFAMFFKVLYYFFVQRAVVYR